jgi:hypothetical protein
VTARAERRKLAHAHGKAKGVVSPGGGLRLLIYYVYAYYSPLVKIPRRYQRPLSDHNATATTTAAASNSEG